MKIYFLIGALNVLTVNGMHGGWNGMHAGRNGMHAGRNGMHVGCTRCCFGTYAADADVDPNHRPGIDPPFRCLDIDECAKGTHHCDIHATCTNLEGGKKDVAGFACQCNEGKRSKHICGFINIYKPLR